MARANWAAGWTGKGRSGAEQSRAEQSERSDGQAGSRHTHTHGGGGGGGPSTPLPSSSITAACFAPLRLSALPGVVVPVVADRRPRRCSSQQPAPWPSLVAAHSLALAADTRWTVAAAARHTPVADPSSSSSSSSSSLCSVHASCVIVRWVVCLSAVCSSAAVRSAGALVGWAGLAVWAATLGQPLFSSAAQRSARQLSAAHPTPPESSTC